MRSTGVLLPCALAALAAAGVVVAEESPMKTAKTPERVWGAPVSGCKVSIGVPEYLHVNQPVPVTVTIRNDDERQWEAVSPQPWGYFELKLRLYDGSEPRRTRYGEELRTWRSGSLIGLRVPPGSERTETIPLSRIFDMSWSGEYTLEVSIVLVRQAFRPPGTLPSDAPIRVTSNALTISVQE